MDYLASERNMFYGAENACIVSRQRDGMPKIYELRADIYRKFVKVDGRIIRDVVASFFALHFSRWGSILCDGSP